MARTFLSLPPTDRVGRYPKHTHHVRSLPYTAQPFMVARVLPGETLQNIFFETRVVTDPVVSSIIGWKKEYYYFYVRITDLLLDAARDMFVDPANASILGTYGEAANSTEFYNAKGAVNWTKKALDRIVLSYFRDEDETVGTAVTAAGVPIVQIRENSFLDSLTDKDDLPEGAAIAGAADMGDLDRLMDAFEQLRALGIANMTYEDWLRSQGISIPGKDENKPELLARFSEFQYPSNTIDPSTGAPSSALSWVFRNSSKDKKFFKEPGFVLGISVTRPKVYFGGLAGSAAGFAGRAWDWMPNYLRQMPETSLKQFAADTGPLGDRTNPTDAYWIDMRDELVHGDQFQNVVAFSGNGASLASSHILALPDVNLKWKYPTEAMCKSFFVDAAGTAFYVKQDGYTSLSIKGHEVDWTQGNFAEV